MCSVGSVGVSMVATVTDIRRPQYSIRNNGTSSQNPSMQQVYSSYKQNKTLFETYFSNKNEF